MTILDLQGLDLGWQREFWEFLQEPLDLALREDEVEVDDELFEGLVIGQDLSE